MARSVWFLFVPFVWVTVAAGCSDEAGTDGADPNATPPAVPAAAGAGGTASVPTPSPSGSAGQAPSNETSNAGVDGAPLDGSAQTGGAGATAAAGGMTAAGGAAGGGGSAQGGATAMGGAPSEEPLTSPFPDSVTRPRIMIVGDSIAAGPGCYKKFLLAQLNANGYSNFDFVGEYTDDCGGGVMHSARSCSTAEQYTQPTFTLPNCNPAGPYPGMASLVAEHQPDLIMLQLGVNDVWGGMAIENILASYATLVAQARAENPNVVLAVAQIQKIQPMDAGGPATAARTQQLIEALPSWAAEQSTTQSPVFVADLWTNSNLAETKDGVHPTDDAGSQRMAQNWFAALSGILPRD